jgi:hypothetical protein
MGDLSPSLSAQAESAAFDFFTKYIKGEMDVESARATASEYIGSSFFHAPEARLFRDDEMLDEHPNFGALDQPIWLILATFNGYMRMVAAIILSEIEGRNLPPKLLEAISDFEIAYAMVREAIASMDGVPPAAKRCFEVLLQMAGSEIGRSLENTLPKWRESFTKGNRGHAAGTVTWLDEFDRHPEWMERKPRGKGMGWAVSASRILQFLEQIPKCPLPHVSTINKERNKRLKQ